MIEFVVTIGEQSMKLTADEAQTLLKELYDLLYKPTTTIKSFTKPGDGIYGQY